MIFESLEMKIKIFSNITRFWSRKLACSKVRKSRPSDGLTQFVWYFMIHIFDPYVWLFDTWKWWKKKKDGSGSSLWYTLKGVTNELTIELSPNWINCFAWTLISTTRVLSSISADRVSNPEKWAKRNSQENDRFSLKST